MDKYGRFAPLFLLINNGFVWSGVRMKPGNLEIELNQTENEHQWVAATLLGSAGLVGKWSR